VTFGTAGTYEVYFSLGDTGAVNEEENLATPTPLNFAFEGEELTRWHANDGEFIGTPGYNDYEMSVGQITVAKGETRNFLIDDVQDGTATRSVYLGMRFVFVEGGIEPEPSPTSLMVSTHESADGAPAHVVLSWESTDGATYTVEASSNLIDWTTVAENLVSEGETTTYSEETSQSVRFFRLHSL
jgi:hypothetical protein